MLFQIKIMLSQIGNIAETEGPPPSSLKNKQYFDAVSLRNSFTMILREKGDGEWANLDSCYFVVPSNSYSIINQLQKLQTLF